MIAFKVFSRTIAAFELVMIFTVSGWGLDQTFFSQKSLNVIGDVTIIGNSVQCLTASKTNFAGTCDTAPGDHVSNDYFTKYIDIDDGNATLDPVGTATFNSSGSTLALPAGSEVVWAGLYWQGFLHTCKNGGTGEGSSQQCAFRFGATYVNSDNVDPVSVDADKIKMSVPHGGVSGYKTMTSSQMYYVYNNSAKGTTYGAFVDITNDVNKTNPNGKYIIADLQSMEGLHGYGNFAAWSIVFIYKDPNGTLHNVTINNGYKRIYDSYADILISGFLTPSTTPIASRLFVFGGEGENLYKNDYIRVGSANYVSNGTNVAYNIFNSTVSSGIPDPVMTNYNGIDIDSFDTGSFMTPNQTSVNLRIGSTTNAIAGGSASSPADAFYPSMIAFSTEIYAPILDITKTPSTSSGTNLTPGSQIYYTTSFKNTGKEVAKEITIFDDFTQNLLIKTDGNVTSPAVYLSDLLDRNATKLKQSIRLSDANSSTVWHCPIGVSSAECTYSDANCSVDYTGDPLTTATKAWCYVPTVGINTTYTMKFSVNIATAPDTKNQEVLVENQMFASYKDNVTGVSMPNSASNIANAGNYGAVIPYIPGNLDVVDNYAVNGYAAGTGLKTKIVSKTAMTQDAVWLGINNTPQPYCPTCTLHYPMPIAMTLSDNSCSTDEQLSTSDPLYMTLAQNATSVTSLSFQMTPRAKQVGKVKIRFIDWSSLLPNLAGAPNNCVSQSNYNANLNGVPQCFNSVSVINSTFPAATYPNVTICTNIQPGGTAAACDPNAYNNSGVKTNVTIKPDKYNNDYGCMMCLADAVNGTSTCSTDNFALRPDRFEFTAAVSMKSGEEYNLTVYAKDYTSTNTQDYNQSVSNLTGAPSTWWLRDSTTQLNTTTYPVHGAVTIAGDWNLSNGTGSVPVKFSDVGRFTLDVNDTNWAAVDTDDTALSDRTVHGEGNVTFIPWDFNISVGSIVNNNGASPSFTYLSNDLNMSARIPITVSAQNKQGAVTVNYANNMYERSVTITPSVSSAAAAARGLTPLTFGVTNGDANFTAGSTSIAYNDPIAARFNFSRDPKAVVSPFDVNSSNGIGSDVNISITDADGVVGAKNQTLASNATFVYGRVIPRDVRVFGNTIPVFASAWYEVYNAPSIGGVALTPSRNDPLWYTNRFHNDVSDGDANVTVVTTVANPTNAPAVGGVETYSFGATAFGGYKAHIATRSWLWYGLNASTYTNPGTDCLTHPCFNISVVPPMGCSGSTNSGSNNKTCKVTTKAQGLTYDYAPATR